MVPDMRGQMVQHEPAQALATKPRPNVHAFDFSVAGAEELNAATSRSNAAMPRHEERDSFAQELLDAVTVPARLGITGLELLLELRDKRSRVGGVGALRDDDRS